MLGPRVERRVVLPPPLPVNAEEEKDDDNGPPRPHNDCSVGSDVSIEMVLRGVSHEALVGEGGGAGDDDAAVRPPLPAPGDQDEDGEETDEEDDVGVEQAAEVSKMSNLEAKNFAPIS